MSKVLVIESYLSKEFSLTEYATNYFVDEYKKLNPNDEIVVLNLNNEEKTHISLNSNNFKTFWNEDSKRYIKMVKEADKIIINSGMINFSINPQLKNFLDNILVSGELFRYKYDGKNKSEGLLDSKTKVQLILAQGAPEGWYPFAAFEDYLKGVLSFVGINQVQCINFYGTKTQENIKLTIEEKFNQKKEEIDKMIENF